MKERKTRNHRQRGRRLWAALLCAALLSLPAWAAEGAEDGRIPPGETASVPLRWDGGEGEVSVIVLEGKVYYRLRDVADLLRDTGAAFNVTWDRQVFVTRGERYDAPPLAPETDPASYEADPQVFVVDGEEATVNSLLLHQHYYLPVRCLNKVIGTAAEEVDGALVFSLQAGGFGGEGEREK